MTATTVGLVYSATTGRLRWWIVPDNDAELASSELLSSGEALTIVPRDQYLSAGGVTGLQTLVNGITGKTPTTEDRYADVDTGGNVVSIVFACPNCGDEPVSGIIRVQHAMASRGDLLIGGLLFSLRLRARKRGRYRRKIFSS